MPLEFHLIVMSLLGQVLADLIIKLIEELTRKKYQFFKVSIT
jgi:hypothetical protein